MLILAVIFFVYQCGYWIIVMKICKKAFHNLDAMHLALQITLHLHKTTLHLAHLVPCLNLLVII